MHLPHDALAPVLGWIGSAVFAIAVQVAQAVPAPIRAWFEGGAYLGLVGCLIYANVSQWRRQQARDKEFSDLHREMRGEWKEQVDRMASALDRAEERERERPDGRG